MPFIRYFSIIAIAWALLPSLATAQSLSGLTADYTYDESGFFTSNATARASLEAALNDLNRVLNQDLSAISLADAQIVRTSGSARAELNFDGFIRNPSRNAVQRFQIERQPGEVRFFVGARPMPFTTNGFVLASATLGGLRQPVARFNGSGADLEAAIRAAETEANRIYSRNLGPEIRSIDSNVNGITYSVSAGLMHSTISFDNDTNNNNVDDLTEGIDPGNQWHFDHTTGVAGNKIDFYTTALHEAMHAIGLGDSNTWYSLIDGNNWTGQHVIDYLGSGAGLIAPGGHIAEGFLSPRITDGVLQESVLTPTAARGERKFLTELDIAFIRDLGFVNATAVPEPASASFAGLILVFTLARRKRAPQLA